MKLNKKIVTKVLEVVDVGLSSGLGRPTPGNMCVEAAVCYALGLPHGDDPRCVDRGLRSLKIILNDSQWSSKKARAKGIRKLAVLQIGTSENFDSKHFAEKLAMYTVNVIVADVFESLGDKYVTHTLALRQAKTLAEAEYAAKYAAEYAANAAKYAAKAAKYAAEYAAEYAAKAANAANAAKYAAKAAKYAAEYAAEYAAKKPGEVRDAVLSKFAEGVCQILIEMGVQGVKYLGLIS